MNAHGPGPWFVAVISEAQKENDVQFFIHTYPLVVEYFIGVELGRQQCKIKAMVGPFEMLDGAKSVLAQWKKQGCDEENLKRLFIKWKQQHGNILNIWMYKANGIGSLSPRATRTAKKEGSASAAADGGSIGGNTANISVGDIKKML